MRSVTHGWVIEYERGRGDKPWIVSKLCPGLTKSGKVPICGFPSKEAAKQQIETWEEKLAADRAKRKELGE